MKKVRSPKAKDFLRNTYLTNASGFPTFYTDTKCAQFYPLPK